MSRISWEWSFTLWILGEVVREDCGSQTAVRVRVFSLGSGILHWSWATWYLPEQMSWLSPWDIAMVIREAWMAEDAFPALGNGSDPWRHWTAYPFPTDAILGQTHTSVGSGGEVTESSISESWLQNTDNNNSHHLINYICRALRMSHCWRLGGSVILDPHNCIRQALLALQVRDLSKTWVV